MRRIAVMSIAAVLGGLGVTPAAHADTPGCVSRHEFVRIAKGMTMTKVHRIFDTKGDLTGLGTPNQLYYYKTCSGRGVVQVVYTQRDRVLSKDARFF